MTKSLLLCSLVLVTLIGCAKNAPVNDRQVRSIQPGPILYHRTGGIAGTDDRVVIWPDGFVEVHGKVLPDGEGWVSKESMEQFWNQLRNWDSLDHEYLPGKPVNDAYTIAITFNGKTVTASDLAPGLPSAFRVLFGNIEKTAAEISAEPKPAP